MLGMDMSIEPPHRTGSPDSRRLSRRGLLGLAAAGAGAAALGLPGRAFASPAHLAGAGTASTHTAVPSFRAAAGGFTLTQNWDFGTNGTIRGIGDLNQNFQYHDQFGTYDNSANALSGQPVEDPAHPARQILSDSMKTYLVPLKGATTVSPSQHNAGCGSFQARWTLANGGSLLGKDILWVFWTSGNGWDGGAEMDVIETFGFDNGGGHTNYDGSQWHSDSVGGSDRVDYGDWGNAMGSVGVSGWDPTQFHSWQRQYDRDGSCTVTMDGVQVQSGTLHWTDGGHQGGTPINMSFLFDAGWGHTQVSSVNHSMAASKFNGCYYEWDYSRVYLRS